MSAIISYDAVESIVKNALEEKGIKPGEPVSADALQEAITLAICNSINSISMSRLAREILPKH